MFHCSFKHIQVFFLVLKRCLIEVLYTSPFTYWTVSAVNNNLRVWNELQNQMDKLLFWTEILFITKTIRLVIEYKNLQYILSHPH